MLDQHSTCPGGLLELTDGKGREWYDWSGDVGVLCTVMWEVTRLNREIPIAMHSKISS